VTLVSYILLFSITVVLVSSQQQHSPLWEHYHYPKDLQQAITKAATYIRHVTNEDGTFKYETQGDTFSQVYPLTYNSVRHAGTIWSLTLYIHHVLSTQPSEFRKSEISGFRKSAVSATKWLVHFIVSPRDNITTYSQFKGLLKTPQTELNEKYKPDFSLGGNGLALVALASMKELHLTDTNIEILRGMGRFIISLMDEEGDFLSHYYNQGKGLNTKKKKCDYYPGEAALALIKLYAVDPQIHWLEAARDILEFLAKKHLENYPLIIDHWYMIATQHIFLYQDLISLSKDILLACLLKFAHDIVDHPIDDWCYTNALMEGLASTCLLFKYEFGLGHHYHGHYDGILEEFTDPLIEGTKKLMSCQGNGGGLAQTLTEVGTDTYRVRIDYNQHALSAWIRTYEYLYSMDSVPKY